MDAPAFLPLWIRIWHWANALLALTLIATGASMHFAAPGAWLIPFRWARLAHDAAGLSFACLYIAFVVANIATGNWRQYWPKGPDFATRCAALIRHYAWGIFKGASGPWPPRRKNQLNALQQIVYWFVMYLLMPGLVASGGLFMWPDLGPERLFGMPGLLPVALFHSVAALGLVLFAILHIYLATTGPRPTSLIRMMISGRIEDDPHG